MNETLARGGHIWSALAASNPGASFVDALLRGTGQVMFQNNPLTGLLFLVGIFYNSAPLGAAGLLGLVSSTAAARLLGAHRDLIRNGLFGFNGVLTGIGLAAFLQFDPALVAYIIIGAATSTVVMMALASFGAAWDVSPLTAPFVLTTWILLFAGYGLGSVRLGDLIDPTLPDRAVTIQSQLRVQQVLDGAAGLTLPNVAQAVFRGPGQVMFQDNAITGVIFLVAILVNSRIGALFAALGSALGLLTALAFGADGFAAYHGLYGYNSVLTAIALGGVFLVITWKSALYALFGAVVTAVVTAFLTVVLSPYGMPALTAPFVLATWLFLLPRTGFNALRPVVMSQAGTPEQNRVAYAGSPPAPGKGRQRRSRRS
ncbi:MAG: urea transporter [Chloroflexi bacterium]|nr:urea transporter [Chloroflexota bacterium]